MALNVSGGKRGKTGSGDKRRVSERVEKYILGNLISFPHHTEDYIPRIGESDFFVDKHRLIFRSILDMKASGDIEPVSLGELYASHHGVISEDAHKTIENLCETARRHDDAQSAEERRDRFHQGYRFFKMYAARRNVASFADGLSDCEFPDTPDTMVSWLSEMSISLAELGEGVSAGRDVTHQISFSLNSLMERINNTLSSNDAGGVVGIPTGMEGLDNAINGVNDGDFIILAGRPSMGKTAAALQFMLNMAMKGFPVLFFSVEMPNEMITLRLLSNLAGVNGNDLLKGKLSHSQWAQVQKAGETLSSLDITINDESDITVSGIKREARRWYEEKLRNTGKRGSIWIDYLQLITSELNTDKTNEKIAQISRELKKLARLAPVIALSQLNRSLEQRPNKRPINSDLRDSGSLEQDADIIAFIYRDEVYNPDTESRNIAELIIGKHRNGPIGVGYLNFYRHTQRFSEREFRQG